jgi:hypothetical protein
MAESDNAPAWPGLDPANLLLIVVGAHLRAEAADRPLAYRLAARIDAWLDDHADALGVPIEPIVCSDIWYLNHDVLHVRPTVSIGGPGVNALSGYFGQKLDPAVLAENKMVIQLDPEFVDLRVCVWGMDHDLTVQAVELFITKYLEGYLRAVATQVEPKTE